MTLAGIDWVNSFFPESLWPPITDSYYEDVARGYDIMQKKKVIICGVCKNIEHNVRNILSKVATLGGMFESYEIFIYENDSTDATVSKLAKYSAILDIPLTLQSETLNVQAHSQDKSLYRRQRMAYARNKYLEYIKNKNVDYVIVLDMDIKCGFSYQGVAHSFSCPIEVMGSNGLIYRNEENGSRTRLFYDTWAYRESEEEVGSEGNLIVHNRGADLVPVQSCFGGMAIYERELLHGLEYYDYDCDHVTLHEQIRENGGSVFLNPSQIVVYE